MTSVRLNININHETAAVLKERGAREGRTVTEMVRRAVAVYDLIAQARDDHEAITIDGREVELL